MKTQATFSTSKLRVLPLEPAINTGCQLRSSDCHNEKVLCIKGAVLNIKFGPFYIFSGVFFHPSQIRLPL